MRYIFIILLFAACYSCKEDGPVFMEAKEANWPPSGKGYTEYFSTYTYPDGKTERLYYFVKRNDTLHIVKPSDTEIFEKAKIILVNGKMYELKQPSQE